jgi:peptidoglycan/LPS O-acetylase OafA/YrhL
MKPPSQSNHLARIDVLRAIAILLVIGCHFFPYVTGQWDFFWRGLWRNVQDVQTPLTWFLYPLAWGWSGVSLFFVISGFCIHHSFLKHEETGGGTFLKKFFWKRFWRIYPPYFVALIVFYFLMLRHPETKVTASDFWLHVFLLHNFSGTTFLGNINGSFWSLAVEAQFYLLFPLVLLLRRKVGMKKMFWSFAAISLGSRIITLFLQDWSQPPKLCLCDFTLTLFVDWLLGAWLAEKWLTGQRMLGATPGMVLLLGIMAVTFTWNKITAVFLGFTAFSVFYAALMELYLFSKKPFGLWEKCLVPVGLCSYSIYLWHQPLIGRVMYWLHKFGLPQTPTTNLAALPAVVLALIMVGFISYKIIELRSIKLGKMLKIGVK